MDTLSNLPDINHRSDIEYLLRDFYTQAFQDPLISTFFIDIAKIDLETHIPHITDFWEQQLFFTGNYKKNVLEIHKNLHHQKALEASHFERWLSLFNSTLDKHFKGPKADLMKTRALSIATVIQIKTK